MLCLNYWLAAAYQDVNDEVNFGRLLCEFVCLLLIAVMFFYICFVHLYCKLRNKKAVSFLLCGLKKKKKTC